MNKKTLINDIALDINSLKEQILVLEAKLNLLKALEGTSDDTTYKSKVYPTLENVGSSQIIEDNSKDFTPSVEDAAEPQSQPETQSIAEPVPIPASAAEVVIEKTETIETVETVEPEIVVAQATETNIIEQAELAKQDEAPAQPHKDARLVTDITKIIGINDQFRFKKELFKNDVNIMFKTIDIINSMDDFQQANAYIKENFNWKDDNDTVIYFYEILAKRFPY